VTTQIALIIVGCVFSALLTTFVFQLRGIRSGFDAGQGAQDRRIDKIEEKLDEMPEKYVFREDFIRWTISIDKKIDDLARDVKRLLEGSCQE